MQFFRFYLPFQLAFILILPSISYGKKNLEILPIYHRLNPQILAEMLLPYVSNPSDVAFLYSVRGNYSRLPKFKKNNVNKPQQFFLENGATEINLESIENGILINGILFQPKIPLQVQSDVERVSVIIKNQKIGSVFFETIIPEAHAALPVLALYALGIYAVSVVSTTRWCWSKMETLPCSQNSNLFSCATAGLLSPFIYLGKGVGKIVGEKNLPLFSKEIDFTIYHPKSIQCDSSGRPTIVRFTTPRGEIEYSTSIHKDSSHVQVYYSIPGRNMVRIRELDFQKEKVHCIVEYKNKQANISSEERIAHESAWKLAIDACKNPEVKEKFLAVAENYQKRVTTGVKNMPEEKKSSPAKHGS